MDKAVFETRRLLLEHKGTRTVVLIAVPRSVQLAIENACSPERGDQPCFFIIAEKPSLVFEGMQPVLSLAVTIVTMVKPVCPLSSVTTN